MNGRRVVLAEYTVFGTAVVLFGLRADWDQPEVAVVETDHTELEQFAAANFGSHHSVRDLIDLGLEDMWYRYDGLVAPLSRWAAPGDIVCLVPHGPLHHLPLHALKVDGSWLIERNTVVYSPSASVLKHCLAGRPAEPAGIIRRTAVVFGDSQGDLPAARAEAIMLAELLGSEPMLGDQVSRENVLRGIAEADMVHFAGHAWFNSREGLGSGLQLAAGEVLTAAEVFGLDALNSYLVALSGCETGAAQQHPGDELIGLTRAFLYARTASVLVSLWEVADESTEFLMRRFYSRLLADPCGFKADALRLAVLDTMAQPQWAAFYHWAPFIMVGDWR
jgi:CHAT domain-containing protein